MCERDFKSLAFTNFATPASVKFPMNATVSAKYCDWPHLERFGNEREIPHGGGIASPPYIPKHVPRVFQCNSPMGAVLSQTKEDDMSRKCRTCAFWVSSDSDDYRVGPAEDTDFPGHGMCRKRAPIGLAVSKYHIPREYEEYLRSYWPLTFEEDWCGEWKPPTPPDTHQGEER